MWETGVIQRLVVESRALRAANIQGIQRLQVSERIFDTPWDEIGSPKDRSNWNQPASRIFTLWILRSKETQIKVILPS